MKKLLVIAMLVVAMVCLFAISASAANKVGTVAVDGLNYTVYDDKTASLKDNRQSAKTEIVIPTTVTYNGEEYTVTATENYALHNSDSLTSIYFPSTITVLGSHTFSNCAILSAVYIDLGNLTSIGTCGLTDNDSTRDYGVKNEGVYFYPTSEYGKETPVKTTDAVFTSLVTLGDGSMQGSNFSTITFGEKLTTIGIQSLRKSKMTSLTVLGDVKTIGNWSVSQCASLTTITIMSENLQTIGGNAFGSCKLVTSIKIDLSNCIDIDDSAFELTGDCQSGNNTNTTTIWTNLNDERIVDLSNVTHIGYEAFGTSNLGGAADNPTKIIWPRALNDIEDQAFRKANIQGMLYINMAPEKTATIKYYMVDGNNFTTVILGAGVSTVEARFASDSTVVSLADEIAFTYTKNPPLTKTSTLYCKSANISHSTKPNVVTITTGTTVWSSTCGIYATVQTTAGQTVKVGTDTHNFAFVDYNNNYCPINVMGDFYCAKCKNTKQEIAVENYEGVTPVLGHNMSQLFDIVYANGVINAGNTTMKCADCDNKETTEGNANAIITFKGFSAKIGGSEIMVDYKIDKDAYNNYKSIYSSFGFGVAARVLNASGASDELVEIVDGVAQATAEKSIVADITTENCIGIMFKITGFSLDTHYNTPLAMCVFVTDGEAVDYICQNAEGVVGQYAVAYATTFNEQATE